MTRKIAWISAAALLGLLLLAILLALLWLLRPDLFSWRPFAGLFDPPPRYFYTGGARPYLPVKEDFPSGIRTASDAVITFTLPGGSASSGASVEFSDEYASELQSGRPLRVAFVGLIFPNTRSSWSAYRALGESKTLAALLASLPLLDPPRPAGGFTSLELDWVGAGDAVGFFRSIDDPAGALGEYSLVFREDNYVCVVSFLQPLDAQQDTLVMPDVMRGYASLVLRRLKQEPPEK